MSSLILLRHGQSEWNRDRRFTGWRDVDLNSRGAEQARGAAVLMARSGFIPDVCFTSLLRRATETLRIVLERLGAVGVPVHQTWRLNERHYGALEGLGHVEAHLKFGPRQVLLWQRHYSVRPPEVDANDPRFPANDPVYAGVDPAVLPRGESLEDTMKRLLPYWEESIVPEIRAGRNVLIVAHGNSLRALITHLDALPESVVSTLHVPTGEPLVYEMDGEAKAIRHAYLRRGPRLLEWAGSLLRRSV
jgi:2,3-bisphosphoglycerate-dependent phosphoglycerate mutase